MVTRKLVHFRSQVPIIRLTSTSSSSDELILKYTFGLSSANKLGALLSDNLAAVHPLPLLEYDPPMDTCKALIGPHAGFSFSGPAAAWTYAAIPTPKIKRIFLLGPSHHVHLNAIGLSRCKAYGTPLGDIPLDLEVIKDLKETGLFDEISRSVDEDEHSLEMHLPYIRHVFGDKTIKLVPLLVGSVSASKMDRYAEVLSEYWKDPETFWVISSDFCHWGTRFQHTPYYPSPPAITDPVPPVEQAEQTATSSNDSPPELITLSRGTSRDKLTTPIWESIQYLDHEAIEILRGAGAAGTSTKFREYLRRTGNTICGRNPILQLLAILEADTSIPVESKFVRYEQSSQCETIRDSSVSYVSGLIIQRE